MVKMLTEIPSSPAEKIYEITEIPSLSIDKMRHIGEKYLAAYPEPNFTHDNHRFAEKLLEFPEDSTNVVKWQALFNIYHQLKNGGTLQTDIATLVKEHFNANISKVSRAFTYQQGIASIWLWHIGNLYLNKHPERDEGLFFSHTNQSNAKALIDNSKACTGRKSWIYLYLIYQRLPNEKGDLAANIRQVFGAHFHEPFEDTIRKLKLTNYTEKSLPTLPDDDLDLSLSQEVEERFYKQQIEQMFQMKIPELSAFEEASVFWYKRQAYVKMAIAGVIIIAPVASVLFLTANIYALLFMGIMAGGGTLVLELVGQAAFKVEHVPDSVWEFMRKSQEEFGLNNIRFQHALEEQGNQLKIRELQISTQEHLLGEQSTQLAKLQSALTTVSGISTQLMQNLTFSEEQKKLFLNNLNAVCSLNSDIAAKAMVELTNISEQNQLLKGNNEALKGEVNRLSTWIKSLEKIVKNSESTTDRQEKITQLLANITSHAGIITGHVNTVHLLAAAQAQAQEEYSSTANTVSSAASTTACLA